MNIITLDLTMVGNAEVRQDKKGNEYLRFKAYNEVKENNRNAVTTIYFCTTYLTANRDLKDGDRILASGKFEPRINRLRAECELNLFIQNLNRI